MYINDTVYPLCESLQQCTGSGVGGRNDDRGVRPTQYRILSACDAVVQERVWGEKSGRFGNFVISRVTVRKPGTVSEENESEG